MNSYTLNLDSNNTLHIYTLALPPPCPLKHMKVNYKHHNALPVNVQPIPSKNRDVLPHNHNAIITPKKIRKHSIVCGLASLHSNFLRLIPKCLLQLGFVNQDLIKFKHCICGPYNLNSLLILLSRADFLKAQAC